MDLNEAIAAANLLSAANKPGDQYSISRELRQKRTAAIKKDLKRKKATDIDQPEKLMKTTKHDLDSKHATVVHAK